LGAHFYAIAAGNTPFTQNFGLAVFYPYCFDRTVANAGITLLAFVFFRPYDTRHGLYPLSLMFKVVLIVDTFKSILLL
jgi:hypothetical protein